MTDTKTTADLSTFKKLTASKYIDQAKWYLNGFWADGGETNAENIFKWTQKFIELDKNKKNGVSLAEDMAHKFLESIGETLTVLELRARLRKIDVDADGKMALLEYLLFRLEKSISACVNNPQGGGDNKAEVDAAAATLDALMESLSRLREDLAKQEEALATQKKAEEEVRKAEAENKAALDDVNKQEDDLKKAISSLEAKIADPATKVVARGQASQELAQLKGKDPLPLNKAKQTLAATVRRVERERKAAEAATKKVEEATAAVADQVTATQKETQAAEATLDKLKAAGGTAKGSIWWMDREIKEAQKYLPQSKQKK